jgi:arylsulfatase A-like enzyme
MLSILLIVGLCAAAPPNVLIISSDSMDGRVLDPLQHLGRATPLPNLRSLASRGANFVSAYSHSPVCGPSRAAALTSRFVSDLGVWNNYQEIADCPSCPNGVDPTCVKWYGLEQCRAWAAAFPVPLDLFQAFEDAGYEMGVFGKIDIGAGTPQRYPSSTGGDDHTGPEVRNVPRGAGLRRNSMAWGGWRAQVSKTDAYGSDNATTQELVAFLRARAPGDRPFFAYAGIGIPHFPFVTTESWLGLVNQSSIHPPWQGPTHPFDTHMSVSKGCQEPTSEAEVMLLRAVYLAMCAQADAFHGDMLGALGALANNTVVVFWSDHGEMAWEASQVVKDSFREPSSRVPLIFAGPGIAQGVTLTTPVSLLDLWPTLSDLTGVAPPPGARGFSLLPQMRAGSQAPSLGDHPGLATGMFFAENSDTGAYMLRQGDLKLIQYGRAFPWFSAYTTQLFNVTEDPLETVDLAPTHQALVQALEAALAAALGLEGIAALEAQVMANDQMVWRRYVAGNLTVEQQRAALEATYKGFNDSDWERVVLWNATAPSSL